MKLSISALLLLTANGAFADCPSSMDHNTLSECIMIEGSGANYQEWKSKFHQADNENYDKADESMISKVTGKDIRQLQPAAGRTQDNN